MSLIFIAYFAFGIGFYVALTMSNPKSFINATTADIMRGILVALIFWPIGLMIQVYVHMMEREK